VILPRPDTHSGLFAPRARLGENESPPFKLALRQFFFVLRRFLFVETQFQSV
jgi:hypothetical protein